MEDGHHEHREALVYEAAAVQASNGATEEFDYIAHIPSVCSPRRLSPQAPFDITPDYEEE